MSRIALGVTAAAAAALASCESTHARLPVRSAPPEPVAATLLAFGPASGYPEPTRLVVRNDAEWVVAWERLTAAIVPRPERPAVDFSEHMLLVATMGARASGGYAVSIPSARMEEEGTLVADVVETSPGAGCLTTAAVTHPAAVARVAHYDGPVAFAVQQAVRACAPSP